jgi:hypothetical protein
MSLPIFKYSVLRIFTFIFNMNNIFGFTGPFQRVFKKCSRYVESLSCSWTDRDRGMRGSWKWSVTPGIDVTTWQAVRLTAKWRAGCQTYSLRSVCRRTSADRTLEYTDNERWVWGVEVRGSEDDNGLVSGLREGLCKRAHVWMSC